MVKLYDYETQQAIPVPQAPGRFQADILRLVGRLDSTRGGRAANWQASAMARRLMGGAPYQPTLDVVLEGARVHCLGWHAQSEPPMWVTQDVPFQVSWGGTDSPAACTVYARRAYDNSWREQRREFVNLVADGTRDRTRWGVQGHLEWYSIHSPEPDPDEVRQRFGAGVLQDKVFRSPVRLLNHSVWPVDLSTGYDNGATLRRVVYIRRGEATITSPDHWREPAYVGPGWWLFVHHRPDDGGVD